MALLGVCRRTILYMLEDGRLDAIQVGRSRRVLTDSMALRSEA